MFKKIVMALFIAGTPSMVGAMQQQAIRVQHNNNNLRNVLRCAGGLQVVATLKGCVEAVTTSGADQLKTWSLIINPVISLVTIGLITMAYDDVFDRCWCRRSAVQARLLDEEEEA